MSSKPTEVSQPPNTKNIHPEELNSYVQDGIFPFLALPRELRDQVYEYTRPCVEPNEAKIVRMSRRPGAADQHPSLPTVCFQLREEYYLRNPRPSKIAVHLTDLNGYIQAFFPPNKGLGENTKTLHIIPFKRSPRRLRGLIPPEDDVTPMISISPLIQVLLRQPNLQIVFGVEKKPSRSALDLLLLITILEMGQSGTQSAPTRVLNNDYIMQRLGCILPLPTIATTNTVKISWCEYESEFKNAIFFIFGPKDVPSWVDGDWVYASNVNSIMAEIDSGNIPEAYLTEEEKLRIWFWNSMGIHLMRSIWLVWIGVAPRDDILTSGPNRNLGPGWVWDHDEDDHLCPSDKFGQSYFYGLFGDSEEQESDSDMCEERCEAYIYESEDDSEESEEDEDFDEDLDEELA